MSDTRARFGDLLTLARRHLRAAAESPSTVTPGRDRAELSLELSHLAAVLARYTGDATRIIGQLPDWRIADVNYWDRAALEADDALHSAATQLARYPDDYSDRGTHSSAAQNVAAAARALTAGRDLLHSHLATDADGAWRPRSPWAAALATPAVTHAILTEAGSLARAAGDLGQRSESSAGVGAATSEDERRRSGYYWLIQADASISAAHRHEPALRDHQELLAQIPVNMMPDRPGRRLRASVPDLCAAIVASAERVRHAAWQTADLDPHSPGICVTSWRRIAAVSTAASHHCHLICQTLADRMEELERQPDVIAGVRQAAAEAGWARAEWLDAARETREITTDTRGYVSLAAAEAAELAEWTGRLAYADTGWTLSAGPTARVRSPRRLAATPAYADSVLAAAHSASESLAALATANLHQARAAVNSRRLLVPTSALSFKDDVPAPFAPAPRAHAASLIACCENTRHAAAAQAQQLALAADRASVPSRHLGTMRAVIRTQTDALGNRPRDEKGSYAPSGSENPEPVGELEAKLRAKGVKDPRLLWQASAVDDAARQVITRAGGKPADWNSQQSPVLPRARAGAAATRTTAHPAMRVSRANHHPDAELEAEL